jgi:spoIIIJ-associated protein
VDSVEASGRSIEDAILQALVKLGRRRDEVDVKVLQEPVRGSRGMSAREARVLVSVAPRRRSAVITPEMADAMLGDGDEGDDGQPPTGAFDEVDAADDGFGAEEYEGDEYDEPLEGEDDLGPELATAPVIPLVDLLGQDATPEQVAVEALRAILAHMGLGDTLIEVRSYDPLTLNVRSAGNDDLSLLIGRRGDTLSALQLVVALIVAKQTGQRERVVVDAEGYRERREENLRSLAQRVAQQVRRSRSPVALEPMPPNERRIIHMELAEDADLTTESDGEGDQRRIIIALRQPQR